MGVQTKITSVPIVYNGDYCSMECPFFGLNVKSFISNCVLFSEELEVERYDENEALVFRNSGCLQAVNLSNQADR